MIGMKGTCIPIEPRKTSPEIHLPHQLLHLSIKGTPNFLIVSGGEPPSALNILFDEFLTSGFAW
jgi:hypothetical protein